MRLLFVLLLAAPAFAQTLVEGSVANSITKAGIGDVKVVLQPMRPADSVKPDNRTKYETTTHPWGGFRIEDVAAGTYWITYTKAGYRLPASARPKPIEIRESGDPVKLQADLEPLSSLSGRVLDDRGEPIAIARLELTKIDAALGRDAGTSVLTTDGSVVFSEFTPPKMISSDGDGVFSLADQPAGTYLLSASVPTNYDPPPPLEGRDRAWVTTYYPNASFRDSAAKIILQPGTAATDLEIKMQAAPVHHVRGSVVTPKNELALNAILRIGTDVVVTEDGNFDIPLVDGEWRISAQLSDEEFGLLKASETVRVTGRDMENVRLRLSAQVAITATIVYDPPREADSDQKAWRTVVYEGREILMPPAVSPAQLSFISRDRNSEFSAFLQLKQDKPARSQLYPGSYDFHINDDPPYFVDSVRIANRATTGAQIDIVALASIDVVMRKTGGSLSGKVENATVCSVVTQSVLSTAPRLDSTVPCDKDGRYNFSALRPGDYFLWAVTPEGVGRLRGAIFDRHLDRYLSAATRITIRPRESSTADLKLTSMDQ